MDFTLLMKRSLFAIFGGLVLLSGCKEKGPLIDFVGAAAVDSTYMEPVPAPQPRNVLVEEFTGQSCSNCPAGHDLLESLANSPANVGHVNIIGLYQNDNSNLTAPVAGSVNDFRTDLACEIAKYSTIDGATIGSIPCAFIDRTLLDNNTIVGRAAWSSTIDAERALPDSINLTVTSKYDSVSNTATIKATVEYVHAFSVPQTLTVVVVEDSIIDKQEFPSPPLTSYPGGINDHYVFTNVFRAMVSFAPTGNPILASVPVKQPGQAYWRKYSYKPNPGYKVKNCRVIAFVSNANGKDHHVRLVP